MRHSGLILMAALAAAALAPSARAANICQADTLTCATTMPVGGYCECTKSGTTQGGTVTAQPTGRGTNSTAGGCGAQPNAPGCR